MITKREVKNALETILSLKIAKIGNLHASLFLQPLEYATKVHISSVVYEGDNFIPQSVRRAASTPLDLHPLIFTWLNIEEELFQISLHYIGDLQKTDEEVLFEIASEFEDIASRWREIFEEKDRQDLIHVHQTR